VHFFLPDPEFHAEQNVDCDDPDAFEDLRARLAQALPPPKLRMKPKEIVNGKV
jgi:hypothetical protein